MILQIHKKEQLSLYRTNHSSSETIVYRMKISDSNY
jgi:hypothetical protein